MKKLVFFILLFIFLTAMVSGVAEPLRARVAACSISLVALAIEK